MITVAKALAEEVHLDEPGDGAERYVGSLCDVAAIEQVLRRPRSESLERSKILFEIPFVIVVHRIIDGLDHAVYVDSGMNALVCIAAFGGAE